jgi:hypothetical protein
MFAAAVGYGPRSERFALTAGAGVFNATAAGFRGSHLGYGARFALTALRFAQQRIAVTPFIGYGSSRATLASGAAAGLPATPQDTGAVMRTDEMPIGVAVGWRVRFAGGRALALSAAPMYALERRSGGSLDNSRWNVRLATVAELAASPRVGVTLGGEFGQASPADEPGPHGSRIGLGVSFAFARR